VARSATTTRSRGWLLLALGAVCMAAVALRSDDDRTGQALAGIAFASLVWSARSRHLRQERARR
jgi:hypothetical protein